MKVKDDLIIEISYRAVEARETADLAIERLSASALVLEKVVGSSRDNLAACAKLEKGLGLPPLDGEDAGKGTFVLGMAERMPRVERAMLALLDEVTEAENSPGVAYTEGFLRCRFQIEAETSLEGLDACQMEEP